MTPKNASAGLVLLEARCLHFPTFPTIWKALEFNANCEQEAYHFKHKLTLINSNYIRLECRSVTFVARDSTRMFNSKTPRFGPFGRSFPLNGLFASDCTLVCPTNIFPLLNVLSFYILIAATPQDCLNVLKGRDIVRRKTR